MDCPWIVSYADDFVILTRGKANEALQLTSAVMEQLELKLNQDKTIVMDARNGNFATSPVLDSTGLGTRLHSEMFYSPVAHHQQDAS